MCHHYVARDARKANLKPEWDNEFSLRANLYQLMLPDDGFYPLAQVPIVRVSDSGEREMVAAEWGFLPGWWKPSDRTPKRTAFQRKCINARSEDVDAKPTYRDSFRCRRCLMPAEEFSERGHYFHLADRRTFAFAALWDQWRGADGAMLETCTLLTTAPNGAVAAVEHNRMPVVLSTKEEYGRWLNPEVTDRPPLEDLLVPTPAELWESYRAPSGAKVDGARVSRSSEPVSRRASSHEQGRLFD